MNIAVVSRNNNVRSHVVAALDEAGHSCLVFSRRKKFQRRLDEKLFELVVVDTNLSLTRDDLVRWTQHLIERLGRAGDDGPRPVVGFVIGEPLRRRKIDGIVPGTWGRSA